MLTTLLLLAVLGLIGYAYLNPDILEKIKKNEILRGEKPKMKKADDMTSFLSGGKKTNSVDRTLEKNEFKVSNSLRSSRDSGTIKRSSRVDKKLLNTKSPEASNSKLISEMANIGSLKLRELLITPIVPSNRPSEFVCFYLSLFLQFRFQSMHSINAVYSTPREANLISEVDRTLQTDNFTFGVDDTLPFDNLIPEDGTPVVSTNTSVVPVFKFVAPTNKNVESAAIPSLNDTAASNSLEDTQLFPFSNASNATQVVSSEDAKSFILSTVSGKDRAIRSPTLEPTTHSSIFANEKEMKKDREKYCKSDIYVNSIKKCNKCKNQKDEKKLKTPRSEQDEKISKSSRSKTNQKTSKKFKEEERSEQSREERMKKKSKKSKGDEISTKNKTSKNCEKFKNKSSKISKKFKN